MTVNRIVHLVAGIMILLSLLLTNLHHPAWVWLTAFVGFNLAQSGITNFCPLSLILKRAGVRDSQSCC